MRPTGSTASSNELTPTLEDSCRLALAEGREELAQLRPTYEAAVTRLHELYIGIRTLAVQLEGAAPDDFTWCEHGMKDAIALRRRMRESGPTVAAVDPHASDPGKPTTRVKKRN